MRHDGSSVQRSLQRGMSLVEFMVGMTVGLIVVAAAVISLLGMRNSSRIMTSSAALEQQASLAMRQIGRQLSQAGAINAFLEGNDPNATPGTGVSTFTSVSDSPMVRFDTRPIGVSKEPESDSPIPLPTVAVFGIDGDPDATPPESDTLAFSYAQPNDGSHASNCSGKAADSLDSGNTQAGNAQRLVSTIAVDNQTHSLTCSGDPYDPAATAQPIVGNVAEMRVSYLAVDGEGKVTYYKKAADVSAAGSTNWSTITAVQICLEMVGERTQAAEQTLDEDCRGRTKQTVNDGRLHRIVRNTFYLRNAL